VGEVSVHHADKQRVNAGSKEGKISSEVSGWGECEPDLDTSRERSAARS